MSVSLHVNIFQNTCILHLIIIIDNSDYYSSTLIFMRTNNSERDTELHYYLTFRKHYIFYEL